MLYFWWGCRRNLTLITLGSERVKLHVRPPSCRAQFSLLWYYTTKVYDRRAKNSEVLYFANWLRNGFGPSPRGQKMPSVPLGLVGPLGSARCARWAQFFGWSESKTRNARMVSECYTRHPFAISRFGAQRLRHHWPRRPDHDAWGLSVSAGKTLSWWRVPDGTFSLRFGYSLDFGSGRLRPDVQPLINLSNTSLIWVNIGTLLYTSSRNTPLSSVTVRCSDPNETWKSQ